MTTIASVESIKDFAAGINFCIPLVSMTLLAARRNKAVLHRAGVVFFAHLSIMNVLLFIQYFVIDVLGPHETETVNIYQTTVFPFGALLMYELTHPSHSGIRLLAVNAAPFFALIAAYVLTWSHALYVTGMVLAAAYGVAALIYTVLAVRRYDRMLRESLSDTEGVDLRWLRGIVCCCLGILMTWVMASVIDSPIVDIVYNVAISAVFFALAFCVYRQEVADVEPETTNNKETTDMREKNDGVYSFESDFKRLFDKERLYLEKDLNISVLSKRLGTNRTYLSRYLNNKLETTFYDYVNRRRTEHAKKLLRETENKLDVIASMSGFNSLITFRRAFFTYEGVTPGDYRLAHGSKSRAKLQSEQDPEE